MISNHAGVIFSSELVLSLWRSYYTIEEKLRSHRSSGGASGAPEKDPSAQNIENEFRQSRIFVQRENLRKMEAHLYDEETAHLLMGARRKENEPPPIGFLVNLGDEEKRIREESQLSTQSHTSV